MSDCENGAHTENTEMYKPALVLAEIKGASAKGLSATVSLADSKCIVYSAGMVASMSCSVRRMPCTLLVNSCADVSLRE